ncbi:PAS domain S-box protein [uncultured Pontibacter sp.]|uniref:PAS domain S-box protein n=1 Tax=uncultured Pontibacter sp. TaxID=453356 RepID=UPI0026181BC9|nr:PAS domain S-box protein [uncultured Pontibacter sp.]
MSLLNLDFFKHLLLNSTDLLSVIDETGMYKYVGDSVEAALGFKAAEMVGQSALEYIHPEDLPAIVEILSNAGVADKVITPPYRFKSKNDGWRWLETTVSNQLHNEAIRGLITNSRDITETLIERSEKDLHEAYYQSLFKEHPDAVFSLNLQGYFKSVNKQFYRILRLKDIIQPDVHFADITYPPDVKKVKGIFQRTSAGEPNMFEMRVVDALDEVKVVHVTLLPVYLSGAVIGVQGIAKDITEAIQAQRLMQEHSEQLRKILESVTEPFFALDATWRYTFTNQAHCDVIQKSRDELLGNSIFEIFPWMLKSDFYLKCREVAQTGKPVYLEETYPDNNNITLSYSIFPFEGGIAINYIDTTAQNVLKREMEKLSLVASKTINGVVIMNKNGTIEWVNDGFTRLSGYSKHEVVGLVPSMLLQGHETDKETEQFIRQKYKEQTYFTTEVLNYRKTGEAYWAKIDVTPIKDAEGNLLNYVAIQTDITEKKKAEAELIKLADDLHKQNLNLQQFTYIVSHNLRAPVANALGLSRLVRKVSPDSPQFETILEKLQTSITQLDGVITDIGTILSVRDADRTLPRENVNLLQITSEVLSTFQDEFVLMNAVVDVHIDSNFTIISNKAYLYSILHNLVSNAVKYSSPERNLTLKMEVSKDDRGYVYTVSDNGLGMDMQLVDNQLFKLYKRFHPNTHGKGIGLFLVKTQVETIGGKIEVKSAPGMGTAFKIFLGAKNV